MTDAQAIEIQEHLFRELERNGFGYVLREISVRFEENFDEEDFIRSPQGLLEFFISESIDVFETISNDRYDNLLSRFNRLLDGAGGRVNTILVELVTLGESRTFNLNDLPSYRKIISEFKEIQEELRSDNRLDM